MVNSVELFKSLEKKLMSTNIEMINEAWNLSNETLQLSKSNPKDCWMKLWDKPLYQGVKVAYANKWKKELVDIGMNNIFSNFVDINQFSVDYSDDKFVLKGDLGKLINNEVKAPKRKIYAIYTGAHMLNKRMKINTKFPFYDIPEDHQKLEFIITQMLEELKKINNAPSWWGAITICHFLTDFGLAIKPDFHVCKTLKHFSLNVDEDLVIDSFIRGKTNLNLKEIILINQTVFKLKNLLGQEYPLRYVDKVLMEFSRQKLFGKVA
jgi:hypothetical protein|tara:strand:- start:1360 stop:2154 length:795 start_codon:yes stop_codon:yes gene_type:complete